MSRQEVNNKQVIFKKFVTGWPVESDMELQTGTKTLELQEGSSDVLVKVLYLSCDPYMRGRMREAYDSYVPPFQPGSPIVGYGVGKVVLSNDPKYKEGDYVSAIVSWEEYAVVSGPYKNTIQKIDISVAPPSYYLGILGMPGFTAYVGFFKIGTPKEGETVLVSAAAGAVGQVVGQFAKMTGCYVVGSAGTQEKIDLLKSKFGYSEAFNYKEESDLDVTLKRYFPKGIDIYFENVGGKMLDAALLNMKPFGRIPACGNISQYNNETPDPIYNIGKLVPKRLKFQGFLQSDHLELYPEFLEKVGGWVKEKKLAYVEDVAHGLDGGPSALIGVLQGKNVGKQVIKVGED